MVVLGWWWTVVLSLVNISAGDQVPKVLHQHLSVKGHHEEQIIDPILLIVPFIWNLITLTAKNQIFSGLKYIAVLVIHHSFHHYSHQHHHPHSFHRYNHNHYHPQTPSTPVASRSSTLSVATSPRPNEQWCWLSNNGVHLWWPKFLKLSFSCKTVICV